MGEKRESIEGRNSSISNGNLNGKSQNHHSSLQYTTSNYSQDENGRAK